LRTKKHRIRQHPYDAYRSLVHTRLYTKLSKKTDQLKQEGRFPFEGEWRSEAEVLERSDELKKRDRELFWDLMLVFMGGIGFVTILFLFLRYVL
jgi:hypothetical protein